MFSRYQNPPYPFTKVEQIYIQLETSHLENYKLDENELQKQSLAYEPRECERSQVE